MEKQEQTELIFSRIASKLGGLTLSQLEKECGLGNGTIGKWVKQEPSVLKLLKVAERLGVSLDYLVGRTENIGEQKNFNQNGNGNINELNIDSPNSPQTIEKISYNSSVPSYSPSSNHEFNIAGNNGKILKKLKIPTTINGNEIKIEVNNQCPVCHYVIKPTLIKLLPAYGGEKNNDYLGVFVCPQCKRVFTVLYTGIEFTPYNTAYYHSSVPYITVDSSYSPYLPPIPALNKVFDIPEFEKFRSVYTDLQFAIAYNIEGLIGVAYRKAIEYLVYEWLIYSTKKTAEELNKNGLERLILDNFQGEDIADFGQKATWLGNDHTHYLNKHEEYNIADLEELFSYFLSGIERKLAREKANKINRK